MGKRLAENSSQHEETPNKIKKLNHHHHNNADEKNEDFVLTKEIVDSTVLIDLFLKSWRIGKPIGKGTFGEIYLASDDTTRPVTSESAKYVAKIEPYSNGPLFVEIHCLLKAGKQTDEEPLPPGMPRYVASGSHYFHNSRYRFLILPRFKTDLHSIIKNRRVKPKNVLTIATQILDVLEHLHDKGYAHSDIKAENLMIGDSLYYGARPLVPDHQPERERKSARLERDASPSRQRAKKLATVQYSGTNPMRSCRRKINVESTVACASNTTNVDGGEIYDEMLQTHYLRPTKSINYSYNEYDDDDAKSEYSDKNDRDFDFVESSPSKRSPPGSTKKVSLHQPSARQHATAQNIIKSHNQINSSPSKKVHREERIFLIDFGLASKFIDSAGVHRPFCMDQRRAHDGTLEFTSRDAHMGAHSRRSDLECLGYNLIYWSQGFLPWKEEKLMTQPEQVHRMKEYFMTDVREMLKIVYGPLVPKYLGDFLNYVVKLAYDERPDYVYCKSIFEREFLRMGCKRHEMQLNLNDLRKRSSNAAAEQQELETICNKMKNIKSAMKLGLLLPFNEVSAMNTPGSKTSPKNLRSKSDKKSKKQKKNFSWAEILSTDPDQIARQRAEKEFEREEHEETEEMPIKYSGEPTYAILEMENRIQMKAEANHGGGSHHHNDNSCSNATNRFDDEYHIQGYTKAMMYYTRKRQYELMSEFEKQPSKVSTSPFSKFQLQELSNVAEENDESETDGESENDEDDEIEEKASEQPETIEELDESEESEQESEAEEIEEEESDEEELVIAPPKTVYQPPKPEPLLESPNIKIRIQRSKLGLRSILRPTRKSLMYKSTIMEKRNFRRTAATTKQQNNQHLKEISSSYDTPPTTTDESSCSSTHTNSSLPEPQSPYANPKTYFRQKPTQRRRVKNTTTITTKTNTQQSRSSSRSTAGSDSAVSSLATRSRTTSTSSSLKSSVSVYSDDSRDSEYSPIKTRFKRKISKKSPLAPPVERRRAENRIVKKRVYMISNVRTISRG